METLGMPSLTPSNSTGRSGVGQDQVGHISTGILQTIQEGVGGTSSRTLYYGTGTAFYQAPSMQRSYGDDMRSFNVKTFGSRGMINVPRRWFDAGPTEIFATYPINYAWAGPEYHVRYAPKTLFTGATSSDGTAYIGDNTTSASTIKTATMAQVLGELGTEIRSGPNILPTYFWSGGVGFALPALIEQNMGGAGTIVYDRYTNFALIMASTPTISMRKDLMQKAGGGLFYDHDTDYQSLPVKFGWVPALTDEGTAINRNAANSNAAENGENLNMIWAPIEWRIHIPIKTPQTNFWNSLLSRKPIDTSCFASDIQYIIQLGNLYEFTDTGTGLAHCPYYAPPLNIACAPEIVAADVVAARPFYHPQQNMGNLSGASTMAGGVGAWVYTPRLADGWYIFTAPAGAPLGKTPSTGPALYGAAATAAVGNLWLPPNLLPSGVFYTGGSIQKDFNWIDAFAPNANVTPPTITASQVSHLNVIATSPAALVAASTVRNYAPKNRVLANPEIWANHYRVCNGFIYGGYGKPRPKMAKDGVNAESDNRYMKDVFSVNSGGGLPITYPSQLTRMEWRNRSLKLTNPALSARLPLQTTPGAAVYYPFSYGFSQTYRVPPSGNPYDVAGIHRWCSNQILASNTTISGQVPNNAMIDSLQENNKITQNITMPGNPVTSMIVAIYREKDRKYNGVNQQGSYNPVLFWNALNPVRCTLKDGQNIMFDYQNTTAFEFGSMVDRPDCFRIPFRGGLCQLDPNNILPASFLVNQSFLSGPMPNGFDKTAAGYLPQRSARNAGYNGQGHGRRFTPIHCTEWYNCHLIEFPLCLHEPLSREGTVQSTPTFSKTLLSLEFYIDLLLKPPRGLDDMYDQTTVLPALWFSGEWEYTEVAANAGLAYNSTAGTNATAQRLPYGNLSFTGNGGAANTYLNCTSNVANTVPNAYILDDVMNPNIYADDREANISIARATKSTNPYYTMSTTASSWNINDGGLMIQITFGQNQVWTISPNRTSMLSTRG